ncbi:MAG TPA: PatB family C-S lyase [Rectinema sp.]|nr:PatB family C-S lyase [Rectinema sp.]
MYNFDTIVDRSNTYSIKWDRDQLPEGCRDAIPMWIADMDFACSPDIVKAIQARAEHPIYGYTKCSEEYYKSFIDWMKHRNGWSIEKDWILFSPGVVPAINLAVLAYTQPGDKIIIQPPVYNPFSAAVLNNSRQLVENPLVIRDGRYTMDFEDLDRKIDTQTKLLILCSPHNPVGRVWTIDELSKLIDICSSHNILIISDEIHSDIILGTEVHHCTASLSEKAAAITITLTAPNKTFNLAGLQIANIVIPNRELSKAFGEQAMKIGINLTNTFGMVAQEAAYTKGEPWLEELLSYLKENYATLKSFIDRRIPSLKVFPLEGTYLPWLDCRVLGLSDAELHDLFLKKARLWLDDGTMFGTGGSGFMRINIACPRSVLIKALEQLENAIKTNA